jgi:heat-inducible transcriptional repressor
MRTKMLSLRSGKILKYIVGEYIDHVAPVPSQDIADNADLGVSPATIRNEMAYLEREGYLIRPHTSAGCIPSDAGYRYYVQEIQDETLSWEEQRRISHTFHQVEKEVEAWVSLTATLLAQSAHNVAVVSLPKSTDCKLKHLELIAVHDERALAVVVLDGARVKQKLVTFGQNVAQPDLFVVSSKLNAAYDGLTADQIEAKDVQLTPLEKEAADYLVEIMKSEDSREYQEPYLEGWHFMLNQPEFAQSEQMRTLMELVERRGLLKVIVPPALNEPGAHVIIGRENRDEAIRNCSVVICQYGLTDEATGTIAVVGPTRMPYRRAIPTVAYLSAVLSQLVAGLYGREVYGDQASE